MSELNIETVKKLTVDDTCVELVAEVFVTEAYAALVREEVNSYILPIFSSYEFRVTKLTRSDRAGELITNPDDLYLDEDNDKATRYFAECHKAHLANKFAKAIEGREPGFCPALVAESAARKAKRNLVEYSANFIGVPALAGHYELSKKLGDLVIKAVVNGPAGKKLSKKAG